MKNCLLFIFLFVFFHSSSGQDHIREINLGNLTPIWSRITVDSLTIDSVGFDGTSHLSPGLNLRVNDSIVIKEYRDLGLSIFDGSFFEMINIYNGKRIWSNGYNSLSTGEREFTRHLFINENGNLEVLGQRRISDSIIYGLGKTQLTIREFDIETGALLKSFYNTMFSEEESLVFQLYKNDLYKVGDFYIYFDDNTHSYFYEKECKRFDLEGNFVDSVFVSRPLKYPTWYGRNMWQIPDGGLISSRYSVEQDISDSLTSEGFDKNEFIIDYYNEDLEHTDSMFLQQEPPYNWRKILFPFSEDYISILSYDSSFIGTTKEYFAYSIYDNSGEHVITFDYGNMNVLNYSVRQIPNTNQFLSFVVVSKDGEKNKWIFQIKDKSGDVKNYIEQEIPDERNIQIRDMDILSDGSLVFTYYTIYDDDNNDQRAISGMFALKLSELGLSSNFNTSISNPSYLVYPNPFKSNITIERVDKKPLGPMEVLCSRGMVIYSTEPPNNSNQMEIELNHLPSGQYYLRWLTKKEKLNLKKIVKL